MIHLEASEWQLLWNVGQSILTGAIGLYLYTSQREQVRQASLDTLEDTVDRRLDQISDRLAKVEAGLTEQPKWPNCHAQIQRIATVEEAVRLSIKASDIARVHQRIDKVDVGLAELRGETRGIQHLLQTIDNFLRKTSVHE